MSKQDLDKLVTEIANTTSKAYREGTLNKETQVVDLREGSITKEILNELKYKDPSLLEKVDLKDVKKAAQIFRRHLHGLLSSYIIGDTLETTGKSDNYRVISSALTTASLKAIQHLESVAGQRSSIKPGRFIAFDHKRTASDTRTASILSTIGTNGIELLDELKSKAFLRNDDYKVITEVLSYYTNNGDKVFLVGSKVEGLLRSGAANEADAGGILKRKNRMTAALKKAIADVNWNEQKGSDSKVENIIKVLNNAAIDAGFSGVKLTLNKKQNKVFTITQVKQTRKATPVKSFKVANKPKVTKSNFDFASLIQFLNSKLEPAVIQNMTGSALHNRTGRFASSVKVVNITESAKDYPVINYTYQRSPYDVFDRSLGAAPWNTPGRDPKKLIETSIRDVARELAIGRFFVRRA